MELEPQLFSVESLGQGRQLSANLLPLFLVFFIELTPLLEQLLLQVVVGLQESNSLHPLLSSATKGLLLWLASSRSHSL